MTLRACFRACWFRACRFSALWLVTILLVAGAVAQSAPASPPVPVSPQSAPQAQQPAKVETGQFPANSSAQPEPEKKITPEQAEQLLRSVDEILKFVSKDTGLPIKHPVKRQLADREQVWRYIQERMESDEDAQRLERSEIELKKFGLLPRDFDLRTFLVELLKEQVAGFYDAKTKTVYLLDWVAPEQQKPVLAHELTHALQDQNYDMQEMTKRAKATAKLNGAQMLDSDERLAALQALTEGQAMIVLLDYSMAPFGSSVAQQPQLVDAVGASLSPASPGMAIFNRAPMFLQQSLLFPYRYGVAFERDLLLAGGKKKAFAEALRYPPEDTRQIMEPKAYMQREALPPLVPPDFEKLAPGYKTLDLSTMGQFDVMLLLTQYDSADVANQLSADWRGGYSWAALIPGGKDGEAHSTSELAIAYVSRWASADAARQFAAIYSQAVPQRYREARKVQDQAASTPASMTNDVPGAGVEADSARRPDDPVAWQTNEGMVTIETRGDLLLITESFDPAVGRDIRDAVLGRGAAAGAKHP